MQEYQIHPGKKYRCEALLTNLRSIYEQTMCPNVYLQRRAAAIVSSFVPQSELTGIGLRHIYNRESEIEKEISPMLVISCVNRESLEQIEERIHLFEVVYFLSLSLTTGESAKLLKTSPIRQKLKMFKELPLDFINQADQIYSLNQEATARISVAEGLTTFLLSYDKFHQFQLSFTISSEPFALEVQRLLKEKLQVLEKHALPNYVSTKFSKVKVLLVDREDDELSPLLYSFLFGPVLKELNLKINYDFITANSELFNRLFPLDLMESSQLLKRLSQQKTASYNAKIDLQNLNETRKIIVERYDRKTTKEQLYIHASEQKAIEQFCTLKTKTAILQQDIANKICQYGEGLSGSNIIKKIREWALDTSSCITNDDFIKVLMMAHMTNSFWFFQKGAFDDAVPEECRPQMKAFQKRVENRHRALNEKPQSNERINLFRHQPRLLQTVRKWKKDSSNLKSISINPSSQARVASKLVFMNGPMGYNEAVMLLRDIKETSQIELSDYSLLCDTLVNTTQYMKLLLNKYAPQY